MVKFKKSVVALIIALAAASTVTGCKGKVSESAAVTEELTEKPTEKTTEVEQKAGTTTVKTKTYTSKDKTMSIKLPDDTWKNTKDTSDALSFEAADGTITVTHMSGTAVASVKLPASKEEVLENLKAAGKDTTKYEVTEFTQQTSGKTEKYHTVVKCTDTTEAYTYSVGYDIVSDTDIYSVTGLVKKDDESALKEIQTAVESFQILKKSTGGSTSSTTKQSETTQSESTSSTGTTKVIYDSNGNAIYVTQDSSGVWKDGNGKTYDLQEYGAMGSDGYWYTYDSSSSNNNSDNNNSTDSTEDNKNNNNSGNATNGFYDQNGNYISVTKDGNGNWVDSYGTVYYFGDNGVTDNAGNYYPYKSSGETNGFYDTNGKYITVTKDSSGNWVDSSGTQYTFGDTGVTDAAGNFYPY